MKIKLIIPIFSIEKKNDMIWFPETELSPDNQVEYIKSIKEFKGETLTVVTFSPYIAEAVCKVFESEIDINDFYSDGEKIISSDEFWKYFAEPMKKMSFDKFKK